MRKSEEELLYFGLYSRTATISHCYKALKRKSKKMIDIKINENNFNISGEHPHKLRFGGIIMEKVVGIEVPELGILDGRNCIYIDTVIQDRYDNLEFKGDINGILAHKIRERKWIPYTLIFRRVIAYFSCELDTYENADTYGYLDYTDFNIVENSKLLANLPIRKDFDRSLYKHYQLFTYDFVYNIIAVSYDISVDL